MKKTLGAFVALVCLVILSVALDLLFVEKHPPVAHTSTTIATTTDSVAPNDSAITCHTNGAYQVVVRAREGAVGTDFLIKHVDASHAPSVCAYTKAPNDIELTQLDASYYVALIGDKLVLDQGTAPYPRTLVVVDANHGTIVYRDSYSAPTTISGVMITYWEPTATTVTAQNCPDLETYTHNGLGVGIEEQVVLDLTTYATSSMQAVRCAPRQ